MSPHHETRRLPSAAWLPVLTLLLAGCATAPPRPALQPSAWALASRIPSGKASTDAATWVHQRLPGKAEVQFTPVHLDGRDALAATAVSAASVVRHRVHVEPQSLGRLRFSWRVPQLIADADLATREGDDSPVRVILAFDGDRSRWSPRDALLSELMRALAGEEMPYATLMYVWSNKREPGTVLHSPRTDRVRRLVLESGAGRLNRWLDYDRDIRTDYMRAFGEPPGALVGVAIMTDSDNTRSTARAWYGPVSLHPSVAPR